MINRNILQLFPYAQREAGCVIICTEFYFKVYGTHKPFLALDLRHHCDFWMFSFLLRYLFLKSFLNNLNCWQELWIPMSGCILQGWGAALCEPWLGRQSKVLLSAPDLSSQDRKGRVWLLSCSLFALSASQSQNTPWICLQLLHECKNPEIPIKTWQLSITFKKGSDF